MEKMNNKEIIEKMRFDVKYYGMSKRDIIDLMLKICKDEYGMFQDGETLNTYYTEDGEIHFNYIRPNSVPEEVYKEGNKIERSIIAMESGAIDTLPKEVDDIVKRRIKFSMKRFLGQVWRYPILLTIKFLASLLKQKYPPVIYLVDTPTFKSIQNVDTGFLHD